MQPQKDTPQTQALPIKTHPEMQQLNNTENPATSSTYYDAPDNQDSFLILESGHYQYTPNTEEQQPSRREQIRQIEGFLRELSGLARRSRERLASRDDGGVKKEARSARKEEEEEDEEESLFLTPLAYSTAADAAVEDFDNDGEIGEEYEDEEEEEEEEAEYGKRSGFASVAENMLREEHVGLVEMTKEEQDRKREQDLVREVVQRLRVLEDNHIGTDTGTGRSEESESLGVCTIPDFNDSSRESSEFFEALEREVARLGLQESGLTNSRVEPESSVDLMEGDSGEKGEKQEEKEGSDEEKPWDEMTREILLAATANVVLMAAVWRLSISYGFA